MKSFSEYNPITVALWYAAVILPAMFILHPALTALSIVGSVLLHTVRTKSLRGNLIYFILFFAIALLNPFFYHNGVTILFFVNDNPITLEALLYGFTASAMIISVIYWFRSFSAMMTSDRLLYVFGSASPKLALILSMALRYVPLFSLQIKKVNDSQKALGLYREDNAIDALRGRVRVFSILVTWALENGVTTADSMTARGYGVGRRTYFSIYRFTRSDGILLAVTLVLEGLLLAGAALDALKFSFYPAMTASWSPMTAVSLAAYTALALLPTIHRVTEEFAWKRLLSRV